MRGHVWRVAVVTASVLIAATIAVGMLVLRPRLLRVPSGSMEPTIEPGDHVVFVRLLRPVARGDIVAFRYPQDPSRSFAMRVIGLPGERVSMLNGIAWIDGQPLAEPYARPISPQQRMHLPPEPADPVQLGPGQYWVLGDNRGDSADSRFWGPVSREAIWARMLVRVWRR